MREAGKSAETRLDFDFGIFHFYQWVDTKLHETQWGKPEEPPTKGHVRLPKHTSVAEVLDLYDATSDMQRFMPVSLPDIDVAAVIEAAFGDEVLF